MKFIKILAVPFYSGPFHSTQIIIELKYIVTNKTIVISKSGKPDCFKPVLLVLSVVMNVTVLYCF